LLNFAISVETVCFIALILRIRHNRGDGLLWNSNPSLVMQRRHRYALRNGRYVMASVALLVKPQTRPADATPWRHGWVIGDPNCRFNARSPLLRCAVWPEGPCENCSHRELR